MRISRSRKDRMMIAALTRYGTGITPCAGKKFDECYSEPVPGTIMFYFNTVDGSTHTVTEHRVGSAPKPGARRSGSCSQIGQC